MRDKPQQACTLASDRAHFRNTYMLVLTADILNVAFSLLPVSWRLEKSLARGSGPVQRLREVLCVLAERTGEAACGSEVRL